jgi:D-alanyl-D-alanine dipeptidase
VTALKNSAGATVGYVAINPTAQYVALGSGAWATTARNTLAMPHINNWDMTVLKRLNITERQSFEFQAQAFNVFNHAQYIAGSVNNVNSYGYTGTQVNTLRPSNADFTAWNKYFSNQPRTLQLVLKYIF